MAYITDAMREFTKAEAINKYGKLDIADLHEAYYGEPMRGFEYEDMSDEDIECEKEFLIEELLSMGEIEKLDKYLK